MASSPDFLHTISVRRHALFNLALLAAGIAFLVGVTLALPVAREAGWWVAFLVVAGGLNAVLFAVVFAPAAVSGGTYRVTVESGWLRVESPHWLFGRSFELRLADIARLVVRSTGDSPNRHEVHTRAGQRFVLNQTYSGRRHLPADQLFALIHQLHPEISVVTEAEPDSVLSTGLF